MMNFLQTAFENSIFISVMIVIFALIRNLVEKRYSAKFRYWVWLVLAARLLLPFDITLPVVKPMVIPVPEIVVYSGVKIDNFVADTLLGQKETAEKDITDSNIVGNINNQLNNSLDDNTSNQSEQKPVRVTLTDILMQVWVVGAALSLCFYMLQYLVTRRSLLRISTVAADKQELLDKIKKEFGISPKCRIALRYCDGIHSPVLMGAICPVIMLPSTEYETDRLEMVLRHELVHFKQKDLWYKFFMVLCVACYWYNPCVYLMQDLSEKDMEISCDAKVIYHKDKQFVESYTASLMDTIRLKKSKSLAFTTSFGTDRDTMIKRMKNIFDTSKKHRGIMALTFAVILAIGAGAMVACTAINNEPTITQLPKIEIPQEVMELILLHEIQNCADTDAENYNSQNFIFEFLRSKNIVEPFKKVHSESYSSYTLPPDVEVEVHNFIYVNQVKQDTDNYILSTFAEERIPILEAEKFKIEQVSSSQGKNGELYITFWREYNGSMLNNIEYIFQKDTAKNIPEILQGIYADGQEYYRIKKISTIVSQTIEEPKTVSITTVEELLDMARDINENGNYMRGSTYLLEADLDLSGIDFPMIGTNDKEKSKLYFETDIGMKGFNSIFDGQGHTIRNLTLEKGDGVASVGLFAHIGAKGVVKNLNIENAKISHKNSDNSAKAAGIIAGESMGQIINCNVQGELYSLDTIGGLVGNLYGTVFGAKISDEEKTRGLVMDCSADVKITGSYSLGGLAGEIHNSDVENCKVTGELKAIENPSEINSAIGRPFQVGTFAGVINNSSLVKCHTDMRMLIQGKNAAAVGYFGGNIMNSATIAQSTYKKENLGNWKIMGWMFDKHGNELPPQDIKPI